MKVFLVFTIAFIAIVGFAYTKFGNIVTETTQNTVKSITPIIAPFTNDLPDGHPKVVVKQEVDSSRVLYLNSEVTQASVSSLLNGLKQLNDVSNEPIYLMINSPGGSVFDGAMLISAMEGSNAPVNTVCDGLCASMAASIHAYGHNRYATDRSVLMYHPASGGAQGQVPNMMSQLNSITRYIDKMVAFEVNRSKMTMEDFQRHVAYEFWVDAEDATNLGLNDAIVSLNVTGPKLPFKVQENTTKPEAPKSPSKGLDLKWISPYPEYWKR